MSAVAAIEGFAIVSEDGMLADARGVMPASLMFPADQRFFMAGLDRADVVAHGRNSAEPQADSAPRWRLIATHRVEALAPHPSNPRARFWNPAGATLETAVAALPAPSARVAAIGATEVFSLFLGRYDAFYLTRAPGVRLPGGRPVFIGTPAQTPEALLAAHGMTCVERQVLDAGAGLAVEHWRRLTPRR